MNEKGRGILLLILIGMILTGCFPPQNAIAPTVELSPSQTTEKQTNTPPPSATNTPQPSPTPPPTSSPTTTPPEPTLVDQIGKGLLQGASLSPDGRWLAVTSNLGLYIFESETQEEINHFPLTELSSSTVIWSPDGTRLALASNLGLFILESEAQEEINHFPFPDLSLSTATWSPEGDQLALGSKDGKLVLWDPESGQPRAETVLAGRINQLAWSPSSPAIAVVAQAEPNKGTSNKSVYLWDLGTQRIQPLLTREDFPGEEEYSLSRIAWSPDGDKIAAGSFSGSVYIQSVNSPAEPRVLHPYQGKLANQEVLNLAWSPDGKQIAVAWQEFNPGLSNSAQNEQMVMIWDIKANSVLKTYPDAEASTISWLPDGTLVTTENNHLVFRDAEGTVDQRILLGDSVLQSSWSGDHRFLLLRSYPGSLTLWDHEGQTSRSMNLDDFYVQGISQTGWSSRGDRLAALGYATGRLSIWAFNDGFHQQGSLEGIDKFAWSPVDNTLAAVNYNDQLALYEGTSLEIIRSFPIPTGQSIAFLAWSPDGKKIALLIQKYKTYGMAAELLDAWITILDAASFTPLHRFGVTDDITDFGQSNSVTCLAWNPDNQQLAGGTYHGDILIWDAAAGQVIQTMSGHDHSVNSLDWSPDSSHLLSGSLDGTAAVWEPASGSMRRQYRNFPGEFQGDVRDVDWKKESPWYAVGAWGEIRILGRNTSYKIPFEHGMIHDIDWSSTDPLLAVSGNGMVQIWRLP